MSEHHTLKRAGRRVLPSAEAVCEFEADSFAADIAT